MINLLDIAYPSTPAEPQVFDTFTIVSICIGVAAVLIVGLVAAVLLKRNKK